MAQEIKEESKEEIKPREEELIKLGPPVTCAKDKHEFRIVGMEMGMRQVQCSKCPIGFYLSGQDELRNGHIYIKGELAI